MNSNSFILKGTILYSSSAECLESTENGYVVCECGKSAGVYNEIPAQYRNLPVYDYSGNIIIPGMADLHIHAPQYAFRGNGMDLELLPWLETYTFPEESKYSNAEYALKAYSMFADGLRKSATTRACIFATIHRKATEILMDLMEETGLETFVGKVNMDRRDTGSLYENSTDESISETVSWLDDISGRYSNTKPILTPRFVPSCSEALLEAIGKIQNIYGCPVQSHLSENRNEIKLVSSLCPWSNCYGGVYDRFGLFGKGVPTIMAHCVYSDSRETDLIKNNGVFIAHCPSSNINVSSGIAPVRKYIDCGIDIGLGSDVAAGESESIFRAIVQCIQVSKLYRCCIDSSVKQLSFNEGFYLATKGGGKFFGKTGSFENGYEFDAVIIDDSIYPCPNVLNPAERLERAVYLALDINGIKAKFVKGRKISL